MTFLFKNVPEEENKCRERAGQTLLISMLDQTVDILSDVWFNLSQDWFVHLLQLFSLIGHVHQLSRMHIAGNPRPNRKPISISAWSNQSKRLSLTGSSTDMVLFTNLRSLWTWTQCLFKRRTLVIQDRNLTHYSSRDIIFSLEVPAFSCLTIIRILTFYYSTLLHSRFSIFIFIVRSL